jgi:hypothetical protein
MTIPIRRSQVRHALFAMDPPLILICLKNNSFWLG